MEALKAQAGTYIGAWVNDRYNPHDGKVLMTKETLEVYCNDWDPTPKTTSTLALTDDWTSGDAHYFKITATNRLASSSFMLIRISGNGRLLELSVSSTAYPASIDPSDPEYRIYWRSPGGLSSAKAITAFSIVSPAAEGLIDEKSKTIAVTVPYGTNVTALVATFTTTAPSVKVGSTVQVSGTTPNDFRAPLIYTVTAADGSTAN